MENFNATRYKLQNVATKRIFEDEGWTLDDTQSSHPSLIRAVYESQQIHPHGEEHGIYRFAEWLPVKRMLAGSCAPVTYKSKGLAQKLGLKNLYITFSGSSLMQETVSAAAPRSVNNKRIFIIVGYIYRIFSAKVILIRYLRKSLFRGARNFSGDIYGFISSVRGNRGTVK